MIISPTDLRVVWEIMHAADWVTAEAIAKRLTKKKGNETTTGLKTLPLFEKSLKHLADAGFIVERKDAAGIYKWNPELPRTDSMFCRIYYAHHNTVDLDFTNA